MKKTAFSFLMLSTSFLLFSGCMLDASFTNSNVNVPTRNINVNSATVESDSNVSAVTDSRTLLTPENKDAVLPQDVQERCALTFNTNESNTTIQYVSSDNTFEMDIPFNADWGTDQFRLSPYYEIGSTIQFGYLQDGESCNPVRQYVLEFNPVRHLEDIAAEFSSDSMYPADYADTVVTTTVDGHTAYQYTRMGLCTNPVIEIVGATQNYLLSTMCNGNMEDLKTMSSTIVIHN